MPAPAPPPPPAPYAGRRKWGEVAFHGGIVSFGVLMTLLVADRLPEGSAWLWVLTGYTAVAVAATLLLLGAQLRTRQLPTVAETVLDGEPALALRSWTAPWWHGLAVDLALAVAGLVVAALGVRAGGDLAAYGAAIGVAAVWLLARLALAAAGRRRRPALWLTRDEVVVDGPTGRGRADRAAVRAVVPRGSWLTLELAEPARWRACPRPWRGPMRDRLLVMDCSDTAHRPWELAPWLSVLVAATPSASRPDDAGADVSGRR